MTTQTRIRTSQSKKRVAKIGKFPWNSYNSKTLEIKHWNSPWKNDEFKFHPFCHWQHHPSWGFYWNPAFTRHQCGYCGKRWSNERHISSTSSVPLPLDLPSLQDGVQDVLLLMVQKSGEKTTQHVWNPVNNGRYGYHISWCRISSIHSIGKRKQNVKIKTCQNQMLKVVELLDALLGRI